MEEKDYYSKVILFLSYRIILIYILIWVKRKDRGTIAIYAGHIRQMRKLYGSLYGMIWMACMRSCRSRKLCMLGAWFFEE